MKDGEFVQVGTAEQVILNPANDYVAAFTKDVPKAKVLTAGSVMRASPVAWESDGRLQGTPVPVSTTLEQLISILAESDVVLPVVDAGDQWVGTVDRTTVLRAMRQVDGVKLWNGGK
jgi:glycine betaine/proline transport system ATP-binding protein